MLDNLNSSVITCLRLLDITIPVQPENLIDDILNDPMTSHRNIMVGVVNYDGSAFQNALSYDKELSSILEEDEWKAAIDARLNGLPKQPNQGDLSSKLANYCFENAGNSTKDLREIFWEAFGDFFLVCPTLNLGRKLAASSLYKVNGYLAHRRSSTTIFFRLHCR